MKERPILFSAPMVRALLAGTKTQTRRVVKRQPYVDTMGNACWNGLNFGQDGLGKPLFSALASPLPSSKTGRVRCPYGAPGERLWVREAWRTEPGLNRFPPREIPVGAPIQYEAGPHADVLGGKLRPGMFMPRWASRITLEVTGVRVEKLQDISEADAVAEGVERSGECNWRDYLDHPHNDFTSARRSYRSLWESINGPGSWDANPWLWVVEFKRIEGTA